MSPELERPALRGTTARAAPPLVGLSPKRADGSALRLVVRRVMRRMPGESQACLVEASDNRLYVAKFLNNPKGNLSIVSDLICSSLYRGLGLPVPETGVIQLAHDQLRLGEWPWFATHRGGQVERTPVAEGAHFFSRVPGEPALDSLFDFLPNSLLARHEISSVFAGALAADLWTGSTQLRQAVFSRNRQSRIVRVFLIGNDGLQPPGSAVQPERFAPAYPFRAVYSSITDLGTFNDIVERIGSVEIDSLRTLIPALWMAGSERLLDEMLTVLSTDRQSIQSRLLRFRDHNPEMFPNWAPVSSQRGS